jgi:DNA-binding beta-propeller fold protein YncE
VIEYRTLNVRIQALHENRYKAIVRGPDGDGQAEFELTFSERDLDAVAAAVSRPRATRRRIESVESAHTREFGARLFDVIFQESTRDVLRASLSQARRDNYGLRLMLELEGAPQLRNVPWELLCDSTRFISTSAYTPVLRYVDIPARPPPLSLQAPLRILGMVSSPGDMPALDAERERAQLAEACRSLTDRGLLEIDWVSEATLSGLLERLNQGDYHIFHFIGHGDFDEQAEDGVLLLEGRAGRSHRVTGVDLATILADQHTLRLAVINACEGARVALDSNGIAANLMQYGLPGVIAMQFEISDEAAIGFARHFYESLARSHPIDEALADARRGMFAEGHGLEWATPVLFTSVDDGRLFEVAWKELDRGESGLALTPEPDIAALSPSDRAGAPVAPTRAQTRPIVQAGRVQALDERGLQEPREVGRRAERGREGHGLQPSPWWVGSAVAAVAAITAAVLVIAGGFSGNSGSSVETAIRVEKSPVGIATGQGRVWVTSSGGRVSWIDPRGGPVHHVWIGGDPNSVAVDPRGYAWVANQLSHQVTWIEPGPPTRSPKVLSRRPVGPGPNTIAVRLGYVWVANSGDGSVTRIDLKTRKPSTSGAVVKHPSGIAVGLGWVWVADSGDNSVARIDPVSKTLQQRVDVRLRPQGIAVARSGIWVATGDHTVSRIDPSRNDPNKYEVAKVIRVGLRPQGIAVARSGIWVANSGDGTVSRIDPASNRILGRPIKLGGKPSAIAAGPGRIWVTNLHNNTVTPIRP